LIDGPFPEALTENMLQMSKFLNIPTVILQATDIPDSFHVQKTGRPLPNF